MLSNRQAQEDAYAIWRAERQPEFDRLEIDELVTRRFRSSATVIRKIALTDDPQGLEFVMSAGTRDRMNDIVEPKGIDHKRFDENPVGLWNHNSNCVIGKWLGTGVRNNQLRGRLQLAPLGTSERTDEIIRLVQANLIRACSIGFIPLESRPLPDGGTHWTRSELLECSLVATPAGPKCLAVARALHVSDATLKECFIDEPETAMDVLATELGAATGKMQKQIDALQAEIKNLKAK